MSERSPSQRRFRLSLRALILFVLGLAAMFGWIERRADVQRQAVAAIERVGGSVLYDWQRVNGNTVRNGKPWWPKWLVDRLGADYFGDVVFVELSEESSDAQLVHVGRLSRLEELYINSHVSNNGLKNLVGLNRLRTLNLSYGAARGFESTPISNACLPYIKGLTGLEKLTLLLTDVTPDGVNGLRKARPKLQITYFDTRPRAVDKLLGVLRQPSERSPGNTSP